MKSLLLHLYQSIAWALAAFCAFALALEWLIPDSVTPYLHILPLAIVSAILLFIDGVFNHSQESFLERSMLMIIPVLLSGFAFLTYRAPGSINTIAIATITALMIASGAFVFLYKRED